MKKLFFSFIMAFAFSAFANVPDIEPVNNDDHGERDHTKRLVFEKYLFADGVDPERRKLDELMVKFFDEDFVRFRNGKLISQTGRDLSYTQDFLNRHPEIEIELIISMPEKEYEDMLRAAEQRSGWDLVDLFSFYRFRLPRADQNPHALLADILNAPEIEIAYYQSIAVEAACQDTSIATPNFVANQQYHDPAPEGTDLDYAQATFGADVTDGSGTGVWCGVIETWSSGAGGIGYDLRHEDWTNAVNATPELAPSPGFSHAAGVGGVIAACDDNGVGVVGYLADETVRFYDINALASVADVYTRVMNNLIAGEVCQSSWGWFTSPMPPGQTCPCNPGQNGMGPPEYDPPTKAAIEALVADGVHVFLSAGNGCTNLDDAVYGNTFRNSTDTGSNYIGGIESTFPGGAHDAICYTCYGERVDLNAWAENVYSCGYGTAFSGAGTWERYASGFNGTSSAGPIVCGVAGVVNNINREINAGANIAPLTMRNYLNDRGTAPGTTPGNIGVMPNLHGILAPNMNWDFRTGWDDGTVPRNTNDATGASAVLPATLNSDPSATYWNWANDNESDFGTCTPFRFYLYRDDVLITTCFYASGGPQHRGWCQNVQSNVRGGRHTIRNESDPLDEVNEYNETADDQSYTLQYVWNPRELTSDNTLQLSRPPTKTVTDQPAAFYNCDGYSGNAGVSGFWEILAVQAGSAAADYDARFYSEAITSTNGFDDYEAWSALVGNADIDFVGINNNKQTGELLASVINWDDETPDYIVEGDGSSVLAQPGAGRNPYGTHTIDNDELFEVWEFFANEVVPYTIEVEVTSGNADLVISVYGPESDYFTRSGALASSNMNDVGGASEFLTFTPDSANEWIGVVIHKDDFNDWMDNATFNLYIGKSLPDLTHNLNTGWSHEVVVRQATGGSPAVLPATLTGNIGTNYLNAAYINQGFVANTAGIMRDTFYVDGPAVHGTGFWSSWAPGATTFWSNQGPEFVFGGRHSVGDRIDATNAQAEWNENNNRHDEQFVWTPVLLSSGSNSLTSVPAPNFTDGQSSEFFAAANQHGWRFTGSYWSAVGISPVDSDDDYNCHIYVPSTGSENGFETSLAPSWQTGNGLNEFCLENGNVNGFGATYDIGVCNNFSYPFNPSDGNYYISQQNSMADLVDPSVNGPFNLPANHIIHVFDVSLTNGVPTRILLDNQGTVDLGLAVFSSTTAFGSRSTGGTIVNANGDSGDESIVYNPTASGWHGVAVFKHNNTDLASTNYRLIIGERSPAAPESLTIGWVSTGPVTATCSLRWSPVTEDIDGNSLVVDHYDIRYTMNPNIPFDGSWLSAGTVTTPGVGVSISLTIEFLRFVVLAVDNDGMILGHTPLPDGGSLQSTVAPPAMVNEDVRVIALPVQSAVNIRRE